MDKEGYVDIKQLLHSINENNKYGREIIKEDLEYIIKHSEKKRHEICGDKIRALYGHSVPMKIEKSIGVPPDILYHGTTHNAIDTIMKQGLLPMSRQYVHLSVTIEMATSVGKRRDSNPIILVVDAKQAYEDGIVFYYGNENVWLCDALPAKYLTSI